MISLIGVVKDKNRLASFFLFEGREIRKKNEGRDSDIKIVCMLCHTPIKDTTTDKEGEEKTREKSETFSLTMTRAK